MAVRDPWGTMARAGSRVGRGRLNRRLLAWFALFSLVPVLATNAIGYRRSRSIIQQLVERYLAAIAEVQAQHIHDRVDRHLLMLQAIVAGNEFLAAGALRAAGRPAGEMGTVADRAALESFLRHKRDELTGLDAIYLLTPDAKIAAAAGDSGAIVTTIPARISGAMLTATIRPARRGVEPQFVLFAPVLRHGDQVALLGATVRLTRFGDFLQLATGVTGNVESFIIDDGGRPLFTSRSPPDLEYGAPLPSPLVARASGAYAAYRDHEGRDVLGAVAAIPGHPWRLIAEVPEAEAFGALRRLGGLSLAAELLLAILLVATAWLVARDVVAPIGRLVHATRRVGQGDLEVRVRADQRDELGELGRAFNEMTAALAHTTARVRELHAREIGRASQLATVGELASGIAHEIKNPIVGISNGLDLVRRRIGDDATLSPIMDEMARQLARIQQALQELLTFARPATPTLAPVSGNDLAQRAIRLVAPVADRAGVHIAVQLDRALPRFMADEEMLHQALINVLMNAVQATPRGGQITVATRGEDDAIAIEVADTGRGIAPADLELVFKPFFTTRHTGTGLGLSITREIAERHGGRVTLESRAGVGTRVTVHLPIRGAAEAAELQEATAV